MTDFPPTIEFAALDAMHGFRAGDGKGRSAFRAGGIDGGRFDDFLFGAYAADPDRMDLVGQSHAGFLAGDGSVATIAFAGSGGAKVSRLGGIDTRDPVGDVTAAIGPAAFAASSGFAASISLATLDGTDGFRLDGIDAFDNSGRSVAGAGDVNGDGFADIIIGAAFAGPGGDGYAGESYVVFGAAGGFAANLDLATLDGSNGFRLDGIDANDRSGRPVAGAGDVNGDGFDDIVIGALDGDPGGNGYAGESYVVFGAAGGFAASLDLASLDGSNGFRLDGIDAYDFSGRSVAGAGDVNGDGFADIVIGAYSANDDAGESYVVFGRAPTTAVTRTGAAGDQIIRGGAFDDMLSGLGGDDGLFGMGGDDTLNGGTGNDSLDGGTGGDMMSGGTGDDKYRVDSAGDIVVEAAGEGIDKVVATVDFDAGDQEIEIIRAMGPAGVTLTASDFDTTLIGGPGNDTLNGRAGNDLIFGYGGGDLMAGGAGKDRYRVDSADDSVVEAAGEGVDKVFTSVDFDAGDQEIEVIRAVSSDGSTLTAGAVDTILMGAGGDDMLIGGTGRDRLFGRGGADTLTGGGGRDLFDFDAGDLGADLGSTDHIADFSQDDRDRIDLRGIDAIDGGGDDAFSFIGTDAFAGTAGELRYEQSGGETHIFGDTDGDGIADFAIVLDTDVALVASDFLL